MTQREILFCFVTIYSCVVPLGFLPWEIRVAFSDENQQRQSRATQPTVHTGCFSISIIHRTLTRTTGSLTCLSDHFAWVYRRDLGLWSHPKVEVGRMGCRVFTESGSGERRGQNLTRDGLQSLWRPRSITLNHLSPDPAPSSRDAVRQWAGTKLINVTKYSPDSRKGNMLSLLTLSREGILSHIAATDETRR